jgi:hypothetical protein
VGLPHTCLTLLLQERQQQLDSGGAGQREAVAALGEQVAASLRTTSVLPTSALLLAVLFAAQHRGGLITAAFGGKLPPNGLASARGTTPALAAAGMEWLADELEQRGAAVVRLPRDSEGQQQQLLLHLAGMLPRCCSTVAGAGNGSAGSGQQAEPLLQLEGGVEAVLLQHSRLNQLLPWFAAEGLVMAALMAATGRQGQGGVVVVEVLESAAWLRRLLAPEIDTGGACCLVFAAALLCSAGSCVQQMPYAGRR